MMNVGKHLWRRLNPKAAHDRSGNRNQCLISSEFGYFGNVNSVIIRNLISSGAFVETQQRLTVGEVVQLKFPLHYLNSPVEVTGVIAWAGSDGVGVKFKPTDERVQSIL